MIKKIVATDEQRAQIIEMYTDKCMSVLAISKAVRLGGKTVRETLVNSGIEIDSKRRREIGNNTVRIQAFKMFDAGKTAEDLDEMAAEIGCSAAYLRSVWRDYTVEHESQEEKDYKDLIFKNPSERFFTMEKLERFKATINVGDIIHMRESGYETNISYNFDAYRPKKFTVKILKKYPNFAMTDKGAKQWIDIWDAVQRYNKQQCS